MTLSARDLLNSAVGRHLCLAYLESLACADKEEDDTSPAGEFQRSLRTASMVIDLSQGSSTVFGWDPHGRLLDQETFLQHLTEEAKKKGLVGPAAGPNLARQIARIELTEIGDLQLMQALSKATNAVHFWGQRPTGEEILMNGPDATSAMLRVAHHIIESEASSWWYEPWAPHEQWLVRPVNAVAGGGPFELEPKTLREHESIAVLIEDAFDQAEREASARKHRQLNPQDSFGDVWWSFPAFLLEKTTSLIPDIGPVDLYCCEDSRGEETKVAWQVISAGQRIFEVAAADDWARLCAWYPQDVTATKLDMWEGNTQRRGKWVVPDWLKMSNDFDGVHLSAAAYISLAGTAIPVRELGAEGEWASSITGWTPDWTFHFTRIEIDVESRQVWQLDDHAPGPTWELARGVDPAGGWGRNE